MMSLKSAFKRATWPGTALMAVILLAAACAEIRPLEYTEIHEIQPGPGLLSGDAGGFILYGD